MIVNKFAFSRHDLDRLSVFNPCQMTIYMIKLQYIDQSILNHFPEKVWIYAK